MPFQCTTREAEESWSRFLHPGEAIEDLTSETRYADSMLRIRAEHLTEIDRINARHARPRPLIDLSGIPPGALSLDTVSRAVLQSYVLSRDAKVFLLFCEVNRTWLEERILKRFFLEGLPFSGTDTAAEVFHRVHDQVVPLIQRFGGTIFSIAASESSNLPPRHAEIAARNAVGAELPRLTVAEWLIIEADSAIQGRIKKVSEYVPGLSVIDDCGVALYPGQVEPCLEFLEEKKVRVPEAVLQGTVARAIVELPRLHRRLLIFRDQLKMQHREIARLLGLPAMKVGIALREASAEMKERVLHVLELAKSVGSPEPEKNLDAEAEDAT